MELEAFESVELSDVGRKRENNEDACLRLPSLGIYCVADGMGGVVGGDLASETVTTTLQAALTRLPPQAISRLSDRVAVVKAAVNQASKWIRDFATEKVIGQMGTTVVALVFDPRNPSRAVSLHAGDSRLYRYQSGRLELLTADHTTAAALAAKLGCSEASLPVKVQNELTRAVGLGERVELDQTHLKVHSGDLFLLCSDGLTRMVPDQTISKVLREGAEEPAVRVARALVDRANEAGGKDNITVVLVRVGDIGEPAESPDDEEFETVVAAEFTPDETATVLAGVHAGPSDSSDTPITYEGETPTTDDPTPRPSRP
jgi:protein phosphatase